MLQAAASGPPVTWAEVSRIAGAPVALGIIAIWRIRSGWGGRSSRLVQGAPWSEFVVSLVYAVMPFTAGMFLMALGGGLGARLSYETGAGWVRIAGLVTVVVGLACMGWGVKEFRSPSSWRSRPEWLREYEARARR